MEVFQRRKLCCDAALALLGCLPCALLVLNLINRDRINWTWSLSNGFTVFYNVIITLCVLFLFIHWMPFILRITKIITRKRSISPFPIIHSPPLKNKSRDPCHDLIDKWVANNRSNPNVRTTGIICISDLANHFPISWECIHIPLCFGCYGKISV